MSKLREHDYQTRGRQLQMGRLTNDMAFLKAINHRGKESLAFLYASTLLNELLLPSVGLSVYNARGGNDQMWKKVLRLHMMTE